VTNVLHITLKAKEILKKDSCVEVFKSIHPGKTRDGSCPTRFLNQAQLQADFLQVCFEAYLILCLDAELCLCFFVEEQKGELGQVNPAPFLARKRSSWKSRNLQAAASTTSTLSVPAAAAAPFTRANCTCVRSCMQKAEAYPISTQFSSTSRRLMRFSLMCSESGTLSACSFPILLTSPAFLSTSWK